MAEVLEILPFKNAISGVASIPGSKSITNRALILASLNANPIKLCGTLFSDDTRFMVQALQKLGFEIQVCEKEKTIDIIGLGGEIPNKRADLFVGNAGTAARFLTAMLATTKNGFFKLDGTEAMRKRPMRGLLEFLSEKGVEFSFHQKKWHFPFTMKTKSLEAGSWTVDASASSQILSALMMIAPILSEDVHIQLKGDTVSKPFVVMTYKMMKQFGCGIDSFRNHSFKIPSSSNYQCSQSSYQVEPDATAASYYFTLPFISGGKINVRGIPRNSLQGDIAYLQTIESLGFQIKQSDSNIQVSIEKELLISGGNFDFNPISDTFLTLAAVSPLMESTLKIYGIEHTRKQETDRIHAMATELKKLGQEVKESEDSITITPNKAALVRIAKKQPIVHTYEDHRVSMSFAILGSYDLLKNQSPWLRIEDPYCCSKTFPNFYQELTKFR